MIVTVWIPHLPNEVIARLLHAALCTTLLHSLVGVELFFSSHSYSFSHPLPFFVISADLITLAPATLGVEFDSSSIYSSEYIISLLIPLHHFYLCLYLYPLSVLSIVLLLYPSTLNQASHRHLSPSHHVYRLVPRLLSRL